MRLAFVGCGDAASTLLLASRFVSRVQPIVFVDTNIDRARRFARRVPGAGSTDDWRSVLEADGVDAVCAAVPHRLHAEIAEACIGAGLAVFLEKPVASTLQAGRQLLDSVGPSAKVGVNYQFRFDRRIRALGESVREGRLGEVIYLEVRVPWYRTDDYFRRAPWHADREAAGGGTMLTHGSHGLDLALVLAADSPARASGATYRRRFTDTGIEDLAMGVVETTSGIPITIVSSMVSRPGFAMSVTVYGTLGSATYVASLIPRIHYHGIRARSSAPSTLLQPYRASLAAFRDWLEGGVRYECTISDALPVLAAIDALYRSAESGRWENVEHAPRGRKGG